MALIICEKNLKKYKDHFLNFYCCSFKSKIPVGIKAGNSNKVSHFSSLNISALRSETCPLLLDVVAKENHNMVS